MRRARNNTPLIHICLNRDLYRKPNLTDTTMVLPCANNRVIMASSIFQKETYEATTSCSFNPDASPPRFEADVSEFGSQECSLGMISPHWIALGYGALGESS